MDSINDRSLISKVSPIFRKLSLIFLVMFFFLYNGQALAHDLSTIDSFLHEVLRYNPVVAKWNGDIRYHTIGLSESENVIFDKVCGSFGEASGLWIYREKSDINTIFIFSDNITEDLARSNVYELFKKEDENLADLLARITESGTDKITVKAVVGPSRIHNYFFIVDSKLIPQRSYPFYCKVLMRTLFGGLTESDIIQDSIMNTKNTHYSILTRFDAAFIEAYYNDAVVHGMPVEEAINIIVKNISIDIEKD